MKTKILCSECVEQASSDGDQMQLTNEMFAEIDLLEWPYVTYFCGKGHREHRIIAAELYELLFHQATYCLEDGYYREAIGTYNAALERYFEYAIEMISFRLTRDGQKFGTLWKEVANQSERQLGAYYFLWYTYFGKLPDTLNSNKSNLRNRVVHKGHLATKEEAKDFGKYVFDYIRRSQSVLHESLSALDLHILRLKRLIRLSSASANKALVDPPTLEHEGETFFKGIDCSPVPSFLSMTTIECYEDCFDSGKAAGCPILK